MLQNVESLTNSEIIVTGVMHREEFIADNMIKVGYAVISAD